LGDSRLSGATKRHNAGISMAYGCDKDPNTYCYRRNAEGKMYLHRIILGRGWENWPFDYKELSCYEKGEIETMVQGRKAPAKPSDEELRIFAEKHNHSNLVKHIKKDYHVGEPTARRWLMEAGLIKPRQAKAAEDKKDCSGCVHKGSDYCVLNCLDYSGYEQAQTQTSEDYGQCAKCGKKFESLDEYWGIDEGVNLCNDCYGLYLDIESRGMSTEKWLQTPPEPTGDQPNPAQEDQEPADKSIKPLAFEGNYFNPDDPARANYTPEDNDFSADDQLQRKTHTRTQYENDVKHGTRPLTDEMLADIEKENGSHLSDYVRNTAKENLIGSWVQDLYKNVHLTNGDKVTIFACLLEMREEVA